MSEYTPTVWKTGDVITAEKLNKIEEGIANAEAGGNSDFYKPVINLEATGGVGLQASFIIILADNLNSRFTTGFIENEYGLNCDSDNVNITSGAPVAVDYISVLNNHKICIFDTREDGNMYTISGDCAVKSVSTEGVTRYYVEVYGNCSISVVGSRIKKGVTYA